MENVAITYKDGQVIFMKNFAGQSLDIDVVMGLSSCVSMVLTVAQKSSRGKKQDERKTPRPSGQQERKGALSSSSVVADTSDDGGNICVMSVGKRRFVFFDLSPFTILADGGAQCPESLLRRAVSDVAQTLLLYLGEFYKKETSELSMVKGVLPYVEHVLNSYQTDLTTMVSGTRWATISGDLRQSVDRLLASVEENEQVFGACLILGNSVLHGRLPQGMLAHALAHVQARPLTLSKMRCVPVYFEGQWRHMIISKLRYAVLVLVAGVKCRIASLVPIMNDVESSLEDTNLPLPTEPKPVVLRSYTGSDTLAFLYKHVATGMTIAPAPRAGPLSQSVSTSQAFSWFHARALQLLGTRKVAQIVLTMSGYCFCAEVTDDHELYVLYNDRISPSTCEDYNKEIIELLERLHDI